MNLLQVRKVTSVSMLILWIVVSATGILLLFTRLLGLLDITIPVVVGGLHTYFGFDVLGL